MNCKKMTISIIMSRFLEYKFSFKFKLYSVPVFYCALITLTSFHFLVSGGSCRNDYTAQAPESPVRPYVLNEFYILHVTGS